MVLELQAKGPRGPSVPSWAVSTTSLKYSVPWMYIQYLVSTIHITSTYTGDFLSKDKQSR
jgi:hypothetical protein